MQVLGGLLGVGDHRSNRPTPLRVLVGWLAITLVSVVGVQAAGAAGTLTATGSGDCGEITVTASGFVPADFEGLNTEVGFAFFEGSSFPDDGSIVEVITDLSDFLATGSLTTTLPGPLLDGGPLQLLGATGESPTTDGVVVLAETTVTGGCTPTPITLDLHGETILYAFGDQPPLPTTGEVGVTLGDPDSGDWVDCSFDAQIIEGPDGPQVDTSAPLSGGCLAPDGAITGLEPLGAWAFAGDLGSNWEITGFSGPTCDPDCHLSVTVASSPPTGFAAAELTADGVVVTLPERTPLYLLDLTLRAGDAECHVDPSSVGVQLEGAQMEAGDLTVTGFTFTGVTAFGDCMVPFRSVCEDLDLSSPTFEVGVRPPDLVIDAPPRGARSTGGSGSWRGHAGAVGDGTKGRPASKAVAQVGDWSVPVDADVMVTCTDDPDFGAPMLRFSVTGDMTTTTTTTTSTTAPPAVTTTTVAPQPPAKPRPVKPRYTG